LSIPKIILGEKTGSISSIFEQIKVESSNKTDHLQSDVLRNYLKNFLLLCERERLKQDFTPVKQDADLDYVMRFRSLLEAKHKYQKLLSKYAEEMHLTLKRLNKATTKVLGKTPKQLLDARVVLESKRLLAHTSLSVKEIAYEMGFEEPTNFIKYFKNHLQITPNTFREQFGPMD
jgi:AraC-like DNA-binding protein